MSMALEVTLCVISSATQAVHTRVDIMISEHTQTLNWIELPDSNMKLYPY